MKSKRGREMLENIQRSLQKHTAIFLVILILLGHFAVPISVAQDLLSDTPEAPVEVVETHPVEKAKVELTLKEETLPDTNQRLWSLLQDGTRLEEKMGHGSLEVQLPVTGMVEGLKVVEYTDVNPETGEELTKSHDIQILTNNEEYVYYINEYLTYKEEVQYYRENKEVDPELQDPYDPVKENYWKIAYLNVEGNLSFNMELIHRTDKLLLQWQTTEDQILPETEAKATLKYKDVDGDEIVEATRHLPKPPVEEPAVEEPAVETPAEEKIADPAIEAPVEEKEGKTEITVEESPASAQTEQALEESAQPQETLVEEIQPQVLEEPSGLEPAQDSLLLPSNLTSQFPSGSVENLQESTLETQADEDLVLPGPEEILRVASLSTFAQDGTTSIEKMAGAEINALNEADKIDFIKLDKETNTALANVEFELKMLIDSGYSSLEPEKTARSDEQGYFSFNAIKPGRYGVFETNNPHEDYPNVVGAVTTFTVNPDGTITGISNETYTPEDASETVRYKIFNEKGKGKITFTKTDANGLVLPNVEFELFGFSALQNRQVAFTSVSDEYGKVTFNNLPLDSYYYLRETTAASGYSIASNLWIVHVVSDDSELGYNVKYYNTGSLTPSGVYGVHPTIPGAWVKMNADKSKYINVETNEEMDTVSGATIKPADLNEYGSWEKLTGPETGDLTVKNKKSDLIVYKKDQGGNPLDSAEFTLTPKDETASPITKTSINGEVGFIDISDGFYELTETRAPNGYDGSTDKWFVKVENGEITVTKNDLSIAPEPGETVYIANLGASTNRQSRNSYTRGYLHQIQSTSEITKVDTVNKTFEQKIVFNVNNAPTRNSTILLSTNNNTTITDVRTTLGIYYRINNTVSLGDAINTNHNSATITITGTYQNQSDISVTMNHTGNGYSSYWRSWNYPGVNTTEITSRVPIRAIESEPTDPEPEIDESIGETVEGIPTVTVINNERDAKGKIKIKKTGPNGSLLEGATFQLRGPVTDSNPGEERQVTTDNNGEYLFEGLTEGIYFLSELKSIDGYIKTDDVWIVRVDKDGNTSISSGEDAVTSTEVITPEPTDSNTTSPIHKGESNKLTQVSNPSENQKQTRYPSYPNPIAYISQQDGEYSEDFDQTRESLRNPWLGSELGNYGGYLTYQGNYDSMFTGDWNTMDFAQVAKYAEKTSDAVEDHNYDITLKVKGNTFPEKEKDRLGVIILYDNSASMRNSVRTADGRNETRAKLAQEATTEFVNDLSKKNPDAEFALVSYGSVILDGRNHYSNHSGGSRYISTNDYSYLNFTNSPSNITRRLPGTAPTGQDYYIGGTYTGGAMLEAEKLIEQAKNRTTNQFDRLVVVNVTDGVPTRSPRVRRITNQSGLTTTTFENINDTTTRASNIMGDGVYYNLRNRYPYDRAYTTVSGERINNHGEPTRLAAENIKNQNVEIFNIGIAVTGGGLTDTATAKTLMANISSGAGYNYDLSDADKLSEAFETVMKSVYRNTISDGIVTDPMGDKVDLVLNGDFSPDDYQIIGIKDGVETLAILDGVTPKYDPVTRTIRLEGLNLGLDEEVIFKYRVRLRTEDPAVADNVYYFTNKETTLQPNPSVGNVSWNFPVPSVKKIGEEPPQEIPILTVTNYRKPSIEFFKTDVIGQPLSGATFQLYKIDKGRTPVGEPITVDETGRISYNQLDVGNYELVEIRAPAEYKRADGPAATFEVTPRGELTNIYGKDLDTTTGQNNIWNRRLPEMEFNLRKIDGQANVIPEGIFEFSLREDKENGQIVNTISTDLSLLGEGNSLRIPVPSNRNGSYILEETKAPDGYARSFDRYYIQISQENRTVKLVKITDQSGNVLKDYLGKPIPDGGIILHSETSEGEKADTSVTLDIVNHIVTYPDTGGIGTIVFIVAGLLIMGIATTIYLRHTKKEELEN